MYQYKYVRIKVGGFFKAGPKEDYQKIIDEHARHGWRFVQVFAPGTSSYGMASYFELIFEREA